MKNTHIITIVSLTFFIGLFSCSDEYLDKTDPERLVSGNFYQTEVQVEQALNGVYSQLQGIISSQWQYNEFITDNTTLHFNIGDRGQGPSLEAIEFWQINSSTGNINALYTSLYGAMVNINTTLAKIEEATFDAAAVQQFKGQLKFMRAYYYFHLVQYFGEVVLITEPLESPSDAWDYERQPVEKVYELIESDLNEAVAVLPVSYSAEQVGRITKGAALSLLGKVYLTRKNYPQAITTLSEVTTLGYELLPNYADVFDPANKNHLESVFEVQFQGGNDLGEHSGFIYTFAPRESVGAVIDFPGQNGGGWNIPSLDMIDAYEEGDLRKEVSLKEGYTSLEGEWVPVPYINKYNHPHAIRERTDDNWPVIRYADVLLMLAEATNEASGPAEAFQYLNPVRVRAGLPPLSGLTQEAFRTAVLQERRIELAFENHRWFDLKRTMTPEELADFLNAYGDREQSNPTTTRGGIPFSAADFVFEPYEALFPIPANEIIINPDLTQNPGY
uniref:RagB/SusD family nutrient uptake outer membrane protein n=1 Tax=Roseihalotalea indica TaxID=2867963 RepID=A0AA49JG29_9BACT|nr:RagB/SusD family nutrient uptake outer membrane protein [Tunicatimonas sp. TK19036]